MILYVLGITLIFFVIASVKAGRRRSEHAC